MGKTKKCPDCGVTMKADAKACPACGYKMPAVTASKPMIKKAPVKKAPVKKAISKKGPVKVTAKVGKGKIAVRISQAKSAFNDHDYED
jgi:uncharacterized membrane protein YvbJ